MESSVFESGSFMQDLAAVVTCLSRGAPHPRAARAAATMAFIFRVAISALLTGRLENVPKPQSGFKNSLSAG